MALDDGAVVIPGEGHLYLDLAGTATRPTDPYNPGPDLVEIGHTSRESPLTIAQDGGERTTHGSWQNSALRESISPVTHMFQFALLQWDALAYQLYYGAGGTTDGDYYGVAKGTPQPTEGAMYIRVDDGPQFADFWIPRVSILRADNVELDPEALTGFPVQATVLGVSELADLFQVGAKRTYTPPAP
ncbi:hypothetical protein CDO52_00180 [Nocardiopsis gilva YIM 90087]|uniref:Uncharacterized protein n=1 Tax=Nocardiopsis gilva YIM 90087 TaxID=1235441 RepID=A0A223RZU9_9ACTN|nr:hypothetical protein [Nocardiopsis gilva]ASU81405.1 hypothetical protein CDO52_00180 [Nocardiopsis gilva YIM 90087]